MRYKNTLEQRVAALEKRYSTIYHRLYATAIRRAERNKAIQAKTRKIYKEMYWLKKQLLRPGMMVALGKLRASVDKGLRPTYLGNNHVRKLQIFLRTDMRHFRRLYAAKG